jgi:hypothetical protein
MLKTAIALLVTAPLLFVVWLFGFVTAHVWGSWIHLLLAGAVVMFPIGIILLIIASIKRSNPKTISYPQ